MGEKIEELTGEIKKLQNENQALNLKLKSKINETANLNAELEQIEFKSTCYYNHLQKPREEKNEMKAELDILKNEMDNSGHLKQGNSLFGEVDDERREMEKKLSSFQIKYESLSKTHVFLVSQNQNMKAQVLPLLQMISGKADVEIIAQLERALSEGNAENQSLMKKIKEAFVDTDCLELSCDCLSVSASFIQLCTLCLNEQTLWSKSSNHSSSLCCSVGGSNTLYDF